MNTSFAAVAALLLVLWFAAARRRPRPLLRSTDTSAIAALNRAQIADLKRGIPPLPPQPASSAPQLPGPADAAARAALLRSLHTGLCGAGAARLEAIRTARAWGHPAVLPLLRRGLRDVDPAVVREAALALERFRGRRVPPLPLLVQPAPPLPRNVARTR